VNWGAPDAGTIDHDQVIKLADLVMAVLRWHADKQLITREMERSQLLFRSTARGHEQDARIIDLTRVQKRVREEAGPSMDSKADNSEGQQKVSG
jgi:hypothetical protein